MNEPITVKLLRTKETKGTCMYTEDGDPQNHKLGTLYVKKDTLRQLTLSSKYPGAISVTVQSADDA